jgi:hypothetical protein
VMSSDGGYTESAIFRSANGEFIGEYVAACAADRCGYFGKTIVIHGITA